MWCLLPPHMVCTGKEREVRVGGEGEESEGREEMDSGEGQTMGMTVIKSRPPTFKD